MILLADLAVAALVLVTAGFIGTLAVMLYKDVTAKDKEDKQ